MVLKHSERYLISGFDRMFLCMTKTEIPGQTDSQVVASFYLTWFGQTVHVLAFTCNDLCSHWPRLKCFSTQVYAGFVLFAHPIQVNASCVMPIPFHSEQPISQ